MKKIIILFICLLITCFSISQTNISGFINTNTTWTTAGSPYIIIGNTLVSHGYTLIINPGVTVKFSDSTALQIDGELDAIGTEAQRILFTSNQLSPTPGYWASIHFADTCNDAIFSGSGNYLSGCIMKYCDVMYGGMFGLGEIQIEGSSPYFSYCRILSSGSQGIYGKNTNFVSDNLVVRGCLDFGIFVLDFCKINIEADSIENNIGGIGCIVSPGYPCYGSDILNIKKNYFYGNTLAAIFDNALNAVISENKFINNTWQTGLIQTGSNEGNYLIQCNSFINNHTTNATLHNTTACIWASDGIIRNNYFYGNDGICSLHNGGVTSFTDNIIDNNTNTFGDNICLFTFHGFTSLTKVFFHNNDLINNSAQNIIQYAPVSSTMVGCSSCDIIDMKFNNLINPASNYEVYDELAYGAPNIYADSNYWGSGSTAHIDSVIFDYFDLATQSVVYYLPILASPIASDTTCQINVWSSIQHLYKNTTQLTIYPNPATTNLIIAQSGNEVIKNIHVYNLLGECVFHQQPTTNNQQLSIDVSELPRGIYFVQITDDNKNVVNRKIVVQ